MELYNGTLGQHSFCVCRPDRPTSGYRVDFSTPAFLDYVPLAQAQVGIAMDRRTQVRQTDATGAYAVAGKQAVIRLDVSGRGGSPHPIPPPKGEGTWDHSELSGA